MAKNILTITTVIVAVIAIGTIITYIAQRQEGEKVRRRGKLATIPKNAFALLEEAISESLDTPGWKVKLTVLLAILFLATAMHFGTANAATVVVTTTADEVNGDTSSVEALIADPGPDGISLRETMLAVNNSTGPNTITFDPSLSGQSIFVTSPPLPIISQDGTTLDGDIDEDGNPDITIDGTNMGSNSYAFLARSSQFTLKGFKITHFTDIPGAVFVWSDQYSITQITIQDNIIESNPGGGIGITNLKTVGRVIEDVTINHNRILNNGGIAILVSGGNRPGASGNETRRVAITNNLLEVNELWGIVVEGGGTFAINNTLSHVTISNNTLKDIPITAALVVLGGDEEGAQGNVIQDVTVTENTFVNNDAAIHIQGGNACQASEEPPSNGDRDTRDNWVSQAVVRKNHIVGGGYGIFVTASDQCATFLPGEGTAMNNNVANTTITDNIIREVQGTGILVRAGIDSSSNSISDTLISHNEVIASGYGVLLVAGDAAQNGAIQNVIANTVLVNNSIREVWGAGIHVRAGLDSSNNTVTDTLISHNQVGTNGDGVFLLAGHAQHNNAVQNRIINTLIRNNLIAENRDWGVFLSGGHGQEATGNSVSEIRLVNDTITENVSWGVLVLDNIESASDNTVEQPTIWNSIVFGNTEDDIAGVDVANVHYSLVGKGPFAGTNGNINDNPQFVDPANGSFRLKEISPAIDKGSSEAPDLPQTDLDGNTRPCGWGYDMGAYEYVPARGCGRIAFRVDRAGDVWSHGAYYGADFLTGGADIAEYTKVSGPVEPGDVVELDPDRPGYHRKSREPYSTLVAGMVSTLPGITMGKTLESRAMREIIPRSAMNNLNLAWATSPEPRASISLSTSLDDPLPLTFEISLSQLLNYLPSLMEKQDKPLLALMGMVPVKATTENGPIQPGDLLTTSSTPGYAMRCGDITKCEGAIIGKALEPLEEGTGLIKMLVMR